MSKWRQFRKDVRETIKASESTEEKPEIDWSKQEKHARRMLARSAEDRAVHKKTNWYARV